MNRGLTMKSRQTSDIKRAWMRAVLVELPMKTSWASFKASRDGKVSLVSVVDILTSVNE